MIEIKVLKPYRGIGIAKIYKINNGCIVKGSAEYVSYFETSDNEIIVHDSAPCLSILRYKIDILFFEEG